MPKLSDKTLTAIGIAVILIVLVVLAILFGAFGADFDEWKAPRPLPPERTELVTLCVAGTRFKTQIQRPIAVHFGWRKGQCVPLETLIEAQDYWKRRERYR